MKKIGIVVLATNAYFVLGVKFIKRFHHFHKDNNKIKFYFFSDTDPEKYVQDNVDINFRYERHDNWVRGTNSKFKNILSLKDEDLDYIYYFDADTSCDRDIDTNCFLGDVVGGEHYGNRTWMLDEKPFDRFEKSKAYVPQDTTLPQMYYYGAFFGGKKQKLLDLCSLLKEWQEEDRKIPYEPAWNDESYLNKYFHFNPPHVIKTEDFPFLVSDKSGIGETRDPNLDISKIKEDLLKYKNKLINISGEKVICKEYLSDSYISYISTNSPIHKPRIERMEKMLKEIGLNYSRFTSKEKTDLVRNRVSRAHRDSCIQASITNNFPFIILEDDAKLSIDFPKDLEVCQEADLIYLGLSCYNSGQGNLKVEDYNEDYYRVFNSLSTHGLLIPNIKSSEFYINLCEEALSDSDWHDQTLARHSHDKLFLTPKVGPVFYQFDSHTQPITKIKAKDFK